MHRAAVEVSAIMRAHGGADRVLMKRWPRALPIYGPGHASRIAAVKEALPPGVATAGAYLDGVGIPDCIRTGEQAAREVVRTLAAR